VPRPEDDPCVRQPDITLARTRLGWQPDVGVTAGLTRTVDWFRDLLELPTPRRRNVGALTP
jgi:dTDP-glucose 4,6-dehydratase